MATQPKYAPSNLGHVEDLEKYGRNGFHPIHLGDKLDKVDSRTYRYEVIHKLGYGGFSTVWLAHDVNNGGYVALKVVCASQSSYGVPPAVESILNSHPAGIFITELRRFLISGPNGRHVCQVLPVTGPSLLALSRVPYRLRPALCKMLLQEAAQALAFLHARGLCHGDFTASNLVLAVSPTLHQLSKQDLLKLLGTPVRDIVYTTGPKTASAPEYVVQPADLAKLGPSYLTDSLRVVDFDQVFGFRKPLPPGLPPSPGFNLGTPVTSLAPEVIIEGAAGPASDIWALGCSLFRMRAGMQLLGEWHFNMASNVLEDIFDVVVGPPPPKWTSLHFRANGWPVASPRSGLDKNITTHEYGQEPLDLDEDLKAKVYGIWDESRSRPKTPGSSRSGTPTGVNSLPSSRGSSPSSMAQVTKSAIFWKVDPHVVPHWANVDGGFPHIHPDEAAQFLHLLRRIFVYDVRERITAAEILKHPWLEKANRGC